MKPKHTWEDLSEVERLEIICRRINKPIPLNPLDELEVWQYIEQWLATFRKENGMIYGRGQIDHSDLPSGLRSEIPMSLWDKMREENQFDQISKYWDKTVNSKRLRQKPGRKKKEKPEKPKKADPDKENFVKLYRYDPELGTIRMKDAPDIPCEHPSDGYLYIYHRTLKVLSHHLAWRLMTGLWPAERIEHVNGDRADNRWSNLREKGESKEVKVKLRYKGDVVSLGYVHTVEQRVARIAHYRGLREIGIDHETARAALEVTV